MDVSLNYRDKMRQSRQGRPVALDVWRAQVSSDRWVEVMLDMFLAGPRPKKNAGLGFDPETDAYRPKEDNRDYSFKLL